MKVSALLKKFVSQNVISVSVASPAGGKAQVVYRNPRFVDQMDAPVARPKVPGLGPAKPSVSDADFVAGLYGTLLGRAPDAEGFRAHLTALANGTSREALRQAFLDSPEYQARTAPRPPEPAPVEPQPPVEPAPAAEDLTAQMKRLVDADVWTAGHRKATQADYDYWLPKLMSPCDSGFVTSGQMTGVEYYHRRMLGWQAGGDDAAQFGPYAGSPEARGPVPSAEDVVGPIVSATGPAQPAPTANGYTEAELRKLVAADIWTAGHRVADDRDFAYWLPMLQGECDSGFVTSGQMTGVEYYHRRILGWQAGGEDTAKFGPYAGSPEAHDRVPSADEVIAAS